LNYLISVRGFPGLGSSGNFATLMRILVSTQKKQQKSCPHDCNSLAFDSVFMPTPFEKAVKMFSILYPVHGALLARPTCPPAVAVIRGLVHTARMLVSALGTCRELKMLSLVSRKLASK